MSPPAADEKVPAEFRDAARGVRLQKVMAEAGVASRRACEALIEAGRVRVNGQVVSGLPAWVDPGRDRVAVDGQAIRGVRPPRRGDQRHVYLLLHKPRRVISTTRDPEGRRDVLDLLPPEVTSAHRLYPVGRLDADSTGLVLLTNDGELAHRLTHPSFGVCKQYLVSVRGLLDERGVERLRQGLHLADRRRPHHAKRAQLSDVKLLNVQQDRTRGDRTQLLVTLHEGQNRQIRRMMAQLGMKVRRLQRVSIGPLRLTGLAPGQWRPLRGEEVRKLRACAGAAPPAARRRRSGR